MYFSSPYFRSLLSLCPFLPRFSAGLTLECFQITTCDERWEWETETGTQTTNSMSVNKLVHITGLGIYWQTKSPSFADYPYPEWRQAMQAWIYAAGSTAAPAPASAPTQKLGRDRDQADNGSASGSPGPGPGAEVQYILSPVGSELSLRLTHTKRRTERRLPKFAVKAESAELRCSVDSNQYRQLFETLDRLQQLKVATRPPRSLCPPGRPGSSKSATREWWKYARKLVALRPQYIALMRRKHMIKALEQGIVDFSNMTTAKGGV